MKKKITLLFIFFLILPSLSFSGEPKINYNLISFSYYNQDAKEVLVLFSFDNYTTNYHMNRRPNGEFILNLSREDITTTLKQGEYYYRIVVDGVYTYDISNPNFIIDPYLGHLSSFSLGSAFLSSQNGPVQIDKETYRFFYRSSSFQDNPKNVMIVGNFNHWQTYSHILKQSEDDNRVWYVDIKIQMLKRIEYMFVIDNKWEKDMNNSEQGRNKAGEEVSLFYVKK